MSHSEGRSQKKSQSAINGVSVGGNFKAEIHQSISQTDERRLYLERLDNEYKGSLAELKSSYKDDLSSKLTCLRQDLRDLKNNCEISLDNAIEALQKAEKTYEISQKLKKRYKEKQNELRAQGLDEEISVLDLLTSSEREELDIGSTFYHSINHAYTNNDLFDVVNSWASFLNVKGMDHEKDTLEEAQEKVDLLKSDIEELEEAIDSASQWIKLTSRNIELDRILKNNLSDHSRVSLEDIKEKYNNEFSDLIQALNSSKNELKRHRDAKTYEFELVHYLQKDGFPLNAESVSSLERFFEESTLSEETVYEIGKRCADDYCKDNLEEYRKTYFQKLQSDGFPLELNSIEELNQFAESLGLNSLTFIRSERARIQRGFIEPFYRENFEEFISIYAEILTEEKLAFSSETFSKIENLEASKGLREMSFEGCDLKQEKEKLIRDAYGAVLGDYRQEYLNAYEISGIILDESAQSHLADFKASTGLIEFNAEAFGVEGEYNPVQDINDIEKGTLKQFYFEKLLFFSGTPGDFDLERERCLALGIREEDLNTVEGILGKGWSLDYFISPTSRVDYWMLIDLFSQRKWKQADELTIASIRNLSGKEGSAKLSKKDLEAISKEDIFTIDKLWIEYSKGRFGFSTQKKIFEAVERKKKWLFEQLGWNEKLNLRSRSKTLAELNFSIEAPLGHLPVWNAKDRQILENELSIFQVWNLENAYIGVDEASNFEDMKQHYSEQGFWRKVKRFSKKAGEEVVEKVLTLYYAAQQPNVPVAAKAAMLGAIGYFILPFDLISDFIPMVGWTDDVTALTAAVASAASYISPEVTKKVKEKIKEIFG